MLEAIFGSPVTEKILFYLYVYKTGYMRGMSRLFNIPFSTMVNQLDRLENGGIIVSKKEGTVRLYSLNPRYPFIRELEILLQRAKNALSEEEVDKYYRMRTRPRRKGKI
ncbi:MAG: ArsR family transcriptional regulator [Elusimicrobia bacterium]|nr:ArsR family transcriptional regulator [Elusimicrobiota bacterium]